MPSEETPIILLDAPEDECCEERGWVDTSVTEDRARDLLAEFCQDEDGTTPCRPDCGPAKRVWLVVRLEDIAKPEDEMQWVPAVSPQISGAREFWEVPCV